MQRLPLSNRSFGAQQRGGGNARLVLRLDLSADDAELPAGQTDLIADYDPPPERPQGPKTRTEREFPGRALELGG